MGRRPQPNPAIVHARRYSARVRMSLALAGLVLLAVDPHAVATTWAAAAGLVVIGVTGLFERVVERPRWVAAKDAAACLAGLLIVGFGGGEVTAVTILWLVSAAVGVLARGGRVGPVGCALLLAVLLSPLPIEGTLTTQDVGLAIAALALVLATGRVSREIVELLRRARHDADHDALTGLLDRDAFRDEVDRLVATTGAGALVVVDLDDFGAVNKRHGHARGDALLAATGRALRGALRAGDAVARVGGDEFAAYVGGGDPERVARRLVAAVAGGPDRPTACAGVARCPRDGDGAESLLAAADVALRVAKRRGQGIVELYEGMPLVARGSEGARRALERMCRGRGLTMAVQPIVNADSGDTHAFEALARFASPGGHGPLHWFALAEELGLRVDLELACLGAALDLLPTLPGGTRLSVNLSASLLLDERATDRIAAAPDVSRLIVEVTEETLVRDGPAILRTIGALRDRGVLFAVDDIGAGYSGLGQLATLRPAYLKLDRGLVRGIDSEPDRASLVRALAGYARSTGGLLVAEGVETPGELGALRAAGVPLVQGFLFARPDAPWPSVVRPWDAARADARRPWQTADP